MAKTLNDVMLEAELYPYSQECFDLMKECSEISLIENFIERQQFLQDNASLYESMITESYFGESTSSDDQIEALTESVKDKIGNVIKTIRNGIIKLLRMMARFFNRLANKVQEQEGAIKQILMNKTTKKYTFVWNAENASILKNLVSTHIKNEDGWNIPAKQPGGLSIQHQFDGVSQNEIAGLLPYFNAALAFNGAKVTIASSSSIASPDQVNDLAEAVVLLKNPNADKISKGIKKLDQTVKSINKKNSMQLRIDSGYLDQVSKELEANVNTINEAFAESVEFLGEGVFGSLVNKGKAFVNSVRGKGTANDDSETKTKNNTNHQDGSSSGGSAPTNNTTKKSNNESTPTPSNETPKQTANTGSTESDGNTGVSGAETNLLNKDYGYVKAIAANSMKVLNAYVKFRSALIAAYGKGDGKMGSMTRGDREVTKDRVETGS